MKNKLFVFIFVVMIPFLIYFIDRILFVQAVNIEKIFDYPLVLF